MRPRGLRVFFFNFIFSKSMDLQILNAVSHVILKCFVTSVASFEVSPQNDLILAIFSAISSPACYQFLILIWSPHQPLIRFLMFEKKVAKSWILAENGLLSLQRAREASDQIIWSYGV